MGKGPERWWDDEDRHKTAECLGAAKGYGREPWGNQLEVAEESEEEGEDGDEFDEEGLARRRLVKELDRVDSDGLDVDEGTTIWRFMQMKFNAKALAAKKESEETMEGGLGV